MTGIDGDHRGAHAEPRHRRTNQPRQRDRVMVKLLSQPDLPDTDVVGTARLRDDVVDDVDGMRVGIQHDSGRHTETNRRAEACYSDLRWLTEALPLSTPLRSTSVA